MEKSKLICTLRKEAHTHPYRRALTGATYIYVGASGHALLKKGLFVRQVTTYILVTEPIKPFGSTLYLFSQLRSFGSVGDRHNKSI